MKLFLVVYLGSQFGGIFLPLPASIKDCNARRDTMRAQQAQVLKSGYSPTEKRQLSLVELQRIKALRFECEYVGKRPSVAI